MKKKSARENNQVNEKRQFCFENDNTRVKERPGLGLEKFAKLLIQSEL